MNNLHTTFIQLVFKDLVEAFGTNANFPCNGLLVTSFKLFIDEVTKVAVAI